MLGARAAALHRNAREPREGGRGPRRSAARGGDAPRERGRRARAQRGADAGARPRSTGAGTQGVVSHPRLGLLLRQFPQISELLGNAPFQQLSVPFSMDKILGGRTGCGMCGPSFFASSFPVFSRSPGALRKTSCWWRVSWGAGGPCPCASVCIAWAKGRISRAQPESRVPGRLPSAPRTDVSRHPTRRPGPQCHLSECGVAMTMFQSSGTEKLILVMCNKT